MEQTIYERYGDERLSDNTHENFCEQCEQCVYWGKSGTAWDNKYNKGFCAKFPYPTGKPRYVINNEAPCPEREVTQ